MSDLALALQVAMRVHAGQVDKQGEPHLLHIVRVVEAVSPEAKVVAALHDVFEDTDADQQEVKAQVGYGTEEEIALGLLTRLERHTYEEYIADIQAHTKIRAGRLAREVKLADLSDNLGRIPPRPALRLGEQYLVARWDREWKSLRKRYEAAVRALRAQEGERDGR